MIDETKDLEYVFWLMGWRDLSTFPPKPGQFKCIITREKIKVLPVDSDPDKELEIKVEQIRKCKIGYVQNRLRNIYLTLDDRKLILAPVNPFDHRHILNVNRNEVLAMADVIEAFRSGATPKINTNPYLRQLATKDVLKRFRNLEVNWNMHISPWEYYETYGDKFLWLKVIAFILALMIVIVPLLLAIAYVLETLNII